MSAKRIHLGLLCAALSLYGSTVSAKEYYVAPNMAHPNYVAPYDEATPNYATSGTAASTDTTTTTTSTADTTAYTTATTATTTASTATTADTTATDSTSGTAATTSTASASTISAPTYDKSNSDPATPWARYVPHCNIGQVLIVTSGHRIGCATPPSASSHVLANGEGVDSENNWTSGAYADSANAAGGGTTADTASSGGIFGGYLNKIITTLSPDTQIAAPVVDKDGNYMHQDADGHWTTDSANSPSYGTDGVSMLSNANTNYGGDNSGSTWSSGQAYSSESSGSSWSSGQSYSTSENGGSYSSSSSYSSGSSDSSSSSSSSSSSD